MHRWWVPTPADTNASERNPAILLTVLLIPLSSSLLKAVAADTAAGLTILRDVMLHHPIIAGC